MDLKKEVERAHAGMMGKINGSARFSIVCDMYNFVQFINKYVPSYDGIKYDDDGYLIINDDMKQMSQLKSIYQQRNYQKYDTLVCTKVLNDMFNTNLDQLILNAHSHQITDDILNTFGLTCEDIQEYESHPWYWHKWHTTKVRLHTIYLSIKYLYLRAINLRLKITIAIKKWFKHK